MFKLPIIWESTRVQTGDMVYTGILHAGADGLHAAGRRHVDRAYSFHPLGTFDERALTITPAQQWHQPEDLQAT